MKASVYAETTIISYLAARPSHDIIVRVPQELTHRWWRQRGALELFASPLVVEEARHRDLGARSRRGRLLTRIVADLNRRQDQGEFQVVRRAPRPARTPSRARPRRVA